jgi:hypothetical protein
MAGKKDSTKTIIGIEQAIKEVEEYMVANPGDDFKKDFIKEMIACVEGLKKDAVPSENADVIEDCIACFAKIDLAWGSNIAEGIISWYLSTTDEDLFKRALQFVGDKIGYVSDVISILACSRVLKKDYPTADMAPFMKSYLYKSLERLDAFSKGVKTYNPGDWCCVFLATLVILAARDVSFLPKIEEVSSFLKDGKVRPVDFPLQDSAYNAGQHLEILTFTQKALSEAKGDLPKKDTTKIIHQEGAAA